MARVNVDQCAFTDARFARLAELCGYVDDDHARGKMLRVWAECVNRGTHILPAWLIEHHLGAAGASRLIESELAEPAGWSSDEENSTSRLVRIRGTAGRTDYLAKRLKFSNAGGKARAQTASREGGKFTAGERTSRAHQPAAGESTSAPTPVPDPTLTPAPVLTERPRERGAVSDADAGSKRKSKTEKLAPPGFQLATDDYFTRFGAAYAGAKPTWQGKQRQALINMLKAHGVEKVREHMRRMYETPPSWLKPPFDIITLQSNFDRFVDVPPDTKRGASGHFDPSMNSSDESNDVPPWELP